MKGPPSLSAILFLLLSLSYSPDAFSQGKGKEYGLSSNGFFGGAGFLYKHQRTNSTYTRFRLGFLKGEHRRSTSIDGNFGSGADTTEISEWDAGIRISLGNERRTSLKGPLKFIRGIDPSVKFDLNRTRRNGNSRMVYGISPALGYRIGIHYDIDPHFYFNLQASPNLAARVPFNRYSDPKREKSGYRVSFGVRYGFTLAFKL